MKKKEEYVCPHGVKFTAENEEALTWLQHFLVENSKKCGPNSRLSSDAWSAISKLFNKVHELHSTVHELEAELVQAEMLITGMAGVSSMVSQSKDEDLN
jgi:hypothetical protein